MVINDIFELKLFSKLFNVQVLNVFHYRLINVLGAPETSIVASTLWTHISTELRALTTTDIIYERIEYANLNNLNEFGAYPLNNVTGTQVAEAFPPYLVAAFRYFRSTRAVRSGFKRFAGIAEGAMVDGVPTAAFLTLTYALSAKLEDEMTSLVVNPGISAEPVILSKVANGQPRPEPLPFTVSYVEFTNFGTQNTRKH